MDPLQCQRHHDDAFSAQALNAFLDELVECPMSTPGEPSMPWAPVPVLGPNEPMDMVLEEMLLQSVSPAVKGEGMWPVDPSDDMFMLSMLDDVADGADGGAGVVAVDVDDSEQPHGVVAVITPEQKHAPVDVTKRAKQSSRVTRAPSGDNKARRRHKDEIEQLRAAVAELESELSRLKHGDSDSSHHTSNESSAVSSVTSSPLVVHGDHDVEEPTALVTFSTSSLWERIAKHQMEEKQKSEVENCKLRDLLESQVKVARSLERILRKRPNTAMLDESNEQHKRLCAAGHVSPPVYEQLLRDARSKISAVDRAIAACGLSNTDKEIHEFRPRSSSDDVMEYLTNRVLPFSVAATADAVWKCLSMDYIKLNNGFYSALETTPSEITARIVVTVRVRRSEVEMTMKFVVKRVVDGDRQLLTWCSLSEKESTTPFCGLHSLKFCERGWGVIKPWSPSIKTNENATPSSVFKTCAHLTQDIAAHTSEQQQQAKLLKDAVLASYNACATVLLQTTENFLMEASLGIFA